MRIICDKCGTKYKVSDSQLSNKEKSAKCLKCGATIVVQAKTSKENELSKETSPNNTNKIIPKVIPKNCGDCRYLSKKAGNQYCTFYQKETSSKSPCLANEILSARKAAKMVADNAKIYNKLKEPCAKDDNIPILSPASTFKNTNEIKTPINRMEENKSITIQCPYCRRPMDIDATVCPHCGKSGGFAHTYTVLYGFLGAIIGMLISFVMLNKGNAIEDVDIFSTVLCGTCVCSPLLWGITLPSVIIGIIIGCIHAGIDKNKIKNNRTQ